MGDFFDQNWTLNVAKFYYKITSILISLTFLERRRTAIKYSILEQLSNDEKDKINYLFNWVQKFDIKYNKDEYIFSNKIYQKKIILVQLMSRTTMIGLNPH